LTNFLPYIQEKNSVCLSNSFVCQKIDENIGPINPIVPELKGIIKGCVDDLTVG